MNRWRLTLVAVVTLMLVLACSFSLGESGNVPSASSGSGANGGARPASSIAARVTNNIDGDTLDVEIDGRIERVRFIGIDTPERGNCYYREASDFTAALTRGQTVWLEADPSQDDRDRYDRILRYIWLDDTRMVNALLVEGGYAFEYTYRNAYRYQASFMQLEAAARANDTGLWSPQTCNGLTE